MMIEVSDPEGKGPYPDQNPSCSFSAPAVLDVNFYSSNA